VELDAAPDAGRVALEDARRLDGRRPFGVALELEDRREALGGAGGNLDGNFYVFDFKSGDLAWKFAPKAEVSQGGGGNGVQVLGFACLVGQKLLVSTTRGLFALGQDPKTATERLLKAIRHPLVHVLGHPTGRLIGRREGLSPDMGALFAAAAEHDVALELNANWQRLDLRDVHVKGALEAGCRIAIDTDAHREGHFDMLVYGVLTARRAGLEPAACVNTWSAEELHAWLRSKR